MRIRTFLMLLAGSTSLLLHATAYAQMGTASAPALSEITSSRAADAANCRDYSAVATFGNTPLPLIGRACRQPDGSWSISEDVLGAASPAVVTYVPPPGGYFVQGDAMLWDFPIGFSIGIPFFIDVHHQFHSFAAFRRFVRPAGFTPVSHFSGFHSGFGHR